MKVCFTAIVLDRDSEHKKLTNLIESIKGHATDFVFGVDSKSVDGTDMLIQEMLPNVDVFTFDMAREDGVEDFARARNLALERVPAECEWWFWADSDDTIQSLEGKTIPEWLADMPAEFGAVAAQYNYLRDDYGNSTTTHLKGRIYRNVPGLWEWRNRVHEDCYPTGDKVLGRDIPTVKLEDSSGDPTDFVWMHDFTDRPSASARNMRVLQKMLEEDPGDARAWCYLGNQLFSDRNFLRATEAYERYINVSGWPAEKYNALIYQAIAYRNLGLMDKAIASDTRAMHLFPQIADAYIGLCADYTRMGQHDRALEFGLHGIQQVGTPGGLPNTTVFFNFNEYAYAPYIDLAVCYYNLGQNENALSAYEQAAKARPEPDLLRKIEHLRWAIKRDDMIVNGLKVAGHLRDVNEPLKALAVLDNLPSGSGDDGRVKQAKKMLGNEVAFLENETSYRNHYFINYEAFDPERITERLAGEPIPRVEWVANKLKQAGAKRILEVGIGDAYPAFYYAQRGIQVVGIDVDRRRVKEANWNAVKVGLLGTRTIEVPPSISFGDCDCPHGESEHGWKGCQIEACECFGRWREDNDGNDVPLETPDITRESPVQFHVSDIRSLSQVVKDLGPFDAVVAAELIEHLPDPEPFLNACDELAPRVLLTTPDGAWDGFQKRHNDHVRAYSLKELAAALTAHGALTDISRISDPLLREQDELVAQYLPRTLFQGDRVVIYCGGTGQGWTPDSIKNGGIGGSETAVIRVAEELVKKGKRVKVWAECEGVWNGVSYSYYTDFVPWECEAFISWRGIGPLPHLKMQAKKRFVWAHDVHFGAATAEQLEGVTVLALSEWHKSFMQERYPTAEIVVTGNGIDPERFDRLAYDWEWKVDRVQHRIIYAQSPDRGLDRVLRMFPKIRAKYPDAELHVFYGFDMSRDRNPTYIAAIEERAKQPGVTLHGRVDQDRLAAEYLKADVLLYPATQPDRQEFSETYCISVVEALAAGCFPITSDHGALRETNRGGAFVRAGTFEDEALFQLFAFWDRPLKEQTRIRDHGHEGKFDEKSDIDDMSGRRWALLQTWERVASQWEELCESDSPPVSLSLVTTGANGLG